MVENNHATNILLWSVICSTWGEARARARRSCADFASRSSLEIFSSKFCFFEQRSGEIETMKQDARSLRLLAFMLALFGLLALSAGIAYGQAIDGSIVGTILDTQGAVVVNADVTAANIATNVVKTTTTGSSGQYR